MKSGLDQFRLVSMSITHVGIAGAAIRRIWNCLVTEDMQAITCHKKPIARPVILTQDRTFISIGVGVAAGRVKNA
jgi:hypothetical protein